MHEVGFFAVVTTLVEFVHTCLVYVSVCCVLCAHPQTCNTKKWDKPGNEAVCVSICPFEHIQYNRNLQQLRVLPLL